MKSKFKVLFFLIFFSNLSLAHAEGLDMELSRADSLFEQNKYTESFVLYDSILSKEEKVSPAMLLKMSFIKEGLEQYEAALYYLNLYYLETADDKALLKMEGIAKENNLEGYTKGDKNFFQSIFLENKWLLLWGLIILGLIFLGLQLFRKIKQQETLPALWLGVVVCLISLFGILYMSTQFNWAVVKNDHSYLMSSPASGSKVVGIIKKGHRVNILDQQDVWVKVQWMEEEAFIKENNLHRVQKQ